jgi:hypothetical protein
MADNGAHRGGRPRTAGPITPQRSRRRSL